MNQQDGCGEVLQSEGPCLPSPTEGAKTLQDMIEMIDNFPYAGDPRLDDYFTFTMEGYKKPFGHLPDRTRRIITWPESWKINDELRTLHLMAHGSEERSDLLNHTIELIRRTGKIEELGERKQQALFTVKLDPQGYPVKDKYVCDIDIGGWQIFGLISFGVGVIGWTGDRHRLYWLQKRSVTRKMHPGKLDMMAGGSIEVGEEPRKAAIREAKEEAGIPSDYSDKHLKPCGIVSYHLAWSHLNMPGSFPHVIHLFEMELLDREPVKHDDEVEEFECMPEEEVLDELYQSRFKSILPIQWIFYFRKTLKVDQTLALRMHRNLVEDGAWTGSE